VAGAHPAGVIKGEATSRHDTMDMRMSVERLAPGMQDTEEADLCAEVAGIASDFPQRFSTGAEQEIVEDFLVLQHQWHQPVREREDHVQVAGGEKFLLAGSDPTIPSGGLTLRAMTIATANGENSITCIMGSIFYWRVGSAWCVVLAGEIGFRWFAVSPWLSIKVTSLLLR